MCGNAHRLNEIQQVIHALHVSVELQLTDLSTSILCTSYLQSCREASMQSTCCMEKHYTHVHVVLYTAGRWSKGLESKGRMKRKHTQAHTSRARHTSWRL